jgi:hypothetical protein
VTNMGRVLFLVSLATILSISNTNGLAAQGHAGTPANGGNVGAGAGVAPHGGGNAGMAVHGASAGAGAAGAMHAMHGSSMAPARAAGHVISSPGSHLAIPRSANGQIMPPRASTVRGTGRLSGSGSVQAQQFRSPRGAAVDFSEDSNVPGLGFDAVHVAATRGNRGRDRRDGQVEGNESGVLFPFFGGGGYYVPTEPDMAGNAQGVGQAVDNTGDTGDQGPGPDDRPADRPSDRAVRMGNVGRVPMEPPAPQVDVPEYVFVRRDGTVFFAVAYSWEQGSLRYISSEGTRRSVSRDTLDLKATQQFNEERGLTFRSPA